MTEHEATADPMTRMAEVMSIQLGQNVSRQEAANVGDLMATAQRFRMAAIEPSFIVAPWWWLPDVEYITGFHVRRTGSVDAPTLCFSVKQR
jgi:hypothetical protein